ncbi:urea amidolyase [Brachybacterium endophyticum]|uniref:Urea amidolyase n=2 Tax=Brachybacterium endophyticum TaxID=2182385 RepID=A0A2U2RK67_9MICO|nr:urea amidolyase [Brachybacterium endophyticum]
MGARALLLELPTLEDALTWHAALRTDPLAGQTSALAAARTVLLRFATPEDADAAPEALGSREARRAKKKDGRTRRVEVVYDGEDLEAVARETGLSADEVISAHTGTAWTAAFGGFAPGFVYLSGGDPRLQVPRRDSPRSRVPAGAVGLAGEFSAIYPQTSPGGWQLIGRTDVTLFDPDRKNPSLIVPGDTVRFEATRERVRAGRRSDAAEDSQAPDADGADGSQTRALSVDPSRAEAPSGAARLEVLDAGMRTLIEDTGRPGLGDLGITVSGAADAPSARQANRLVGNAPGAAVLENLLGGLRVRPHGDLVLALTGAVGEATIAAFDAEPREDESEDEEESEDSSQPRQRRAPLHEPFGLRAGEVLSLGAPASGLRGYLAVRGGIDAPAQLGSRASDTLSGLGPRPLGGGDLLSIGEPDPQRSVGSAEAPVTALAPPDGDSGGVEPAVVRVRPGPRADWAQPDALLGRTWQIGGSSDRVGARLRAADGTPPLRRLRTEELRSEGLVAGAIQLPPSGEPVVFLVDHPVTGGYPVIAVVEEDDLPRLGQLPPGTPLRFEHAEEPGEHAEKTGESGA